MSHTPGPWKIVRGGTCYYPLIIEDTNGYEVVSFHTWDKAKDSKAHLIAAAPTMKEALEGLLEHMWETEVNGIGIESPSDALGEAIKKAQKALTLANGKDHKP